MSERKINLVVPLTAEEVEETRQAFKVLAHHPSEVADVASAVDALAARHPAVEDELTAVASRLRLGSQVAHACSERVWARLGKGMLHDHQGAVQ